MCTLAVHGGWLDTVPGFPDRLRENPSLLVGGQRSRTVGKLLTGPNRWHHCRIVS